MIADDFAAIAEAVAKLEESKKPKVDPKDQSWADAAIADTADAYIPAMYNPDEDVIGEYFDGPFGPFG